GRRSHVGRGCQGVERRGLALAGHIPNLSAVPIGGLRRPDRVFPAPPRSRSGSVGYPAGRSPDLRLIPRAPATMREAMRRRPRVRIRRIGRGDPHAERREALAAVTRYIGLVRAPIYPTAPGPVTREIVVATYNVHRWTSVATRRAPDSERAHFVISELGADVIALQEAVRPFAGEDPLVRLADRL